MCALSLEPIVAVGPRPTAVALSPGWQPRRSLLLGGQDPHNMGSILRSALAYGVDMVYVQPHSPDPFSPLVLRSSAGASLSLRFGSEEDARELASASRTLRVFCAEAHDGSSVPAHAQDSFLLVLGHEQRGVSEEWLCRGERITLPLPGLARLPQAATVTHTEGSVDSLSVAVAAAVLLDRLVMGRPT